MFIGGYHPGWHHYPHLSVMILQVLFPQGKWKQLMGALRCNPDEVVLTTHIYIYIMDQFHNMNCPSVVACYCCSYSRTLQNTHSQWAQIQVYWKSPSRHAVFFNVWFVDLRAKLAEQLLVILSFSTWKWMMKVKDLMSFEVPDLFLFVRPQRSPGDVVGRVDWYPYHGWMGWRMIDHPYRLLMLMTHYC